MRAWEREGPGGLSALRDRLPDRRVVHHAHAAFLPGGARESATRPDSWSVDVWEFETDLYTDQVVRWSTGRRVGGVIDVRASGTVEGAVTAAFAAACAQAVDRAKDPGKFGDGEER
ncbi:hypothetical protein FNV68_43480 [Streptomyces sp. S1D4-23]|nr:hypothetical protein FNV68_43480 [Streptomyces sp. S1D4-23]